MVMAVLGQPLDNPVSLSTPLLCPQPELLCLIALSLRQSLPFRTYVYARPPKPCPLRGRASFSEWQIPSKDLISTEQSIERLLYRKH